MSEVIQVKGLKKYFGKTRAVDGVDIDVKKGEIFGFLGPNGAGKTTLIRCLMDFIRPTAGQITILGKNSIINSSELKKDIGFLPGNVRLYDSWTGKEHISFFNHLAPIKKLPTSFPQSLILIKIKNLKIFHQEISKSLGLFLH